MVHHKKSVFSQQSLFSKTSATFSENPADDGCNVVYL